MIPIETMKEHKAKLDAWVTACLREDVPYLEVSFLLSMALASLAQAELKNGLTPERETVTKFDG